MCFPSDLTSTVVIDMGDLEVVYPEPHSECSEFHLLTGHIDVESGLAVSQTG